MMYLAPFFLVCAVILTSCSNEKEVEAIKPSPEVKKVAEKIFIKIDASEFTDAKKGDIIHTSLQDGMAYDLHISRISESVPGIVNILANVGSQDIGQAALILRDGKLAGSIDMYSLKMRYTLAYDSTMAQHYIQEAFLDDEKVLPGSKPVTPFGSKK